MPIYDYQCQSCRRRFEQLVKQDETPVCPACGATDPLRLFSATAAVSTGRTRGRALATERSKARAQKVEKDHAHREYLQNHIKDHS
jgi:putative FmdB family regulatory protein